jgi:hypothetical protein
VSTIAYGLDVVDFWRIAEMVNVKDLIPFIRILIIVTSRLFGYKYRNPM